MLAVFASLLGLVAVAGAAPAVTQRLENDQLVAEIDPARGATLVSLQRQDHKTELLAEPSLVDAVLLATGKCLDVSALPFAPAAAPQPGQYHARAVLDPATLGPEAPAWLGSLSLSKSFSLPPGAAACRVEYALANAGTAPVSLGLRIRVSLLRGGDGLRLALPTRLGGVTFPQQAVPPAVLARQADLYDLAEAWGAALTSEGRGIAAVFDPRYLSCLQVNTEKRQVAFVSTILTIAPGQTVRLPVSLQALVDCKRLTHAAAELVAGFTVTPAAADAGPDLAPQDVRDRLRAAADFALKTATRDDALRPQAPDVNLDEPGPPGDAEADAEQQARYEGEPLRLAVSLGAPTAGERRVAWSARALRSADWKPFGTEATVRLSPGRAADVTQPFRPERQGTYLVRAEVRDGQRPVAAFEQPVTAGGRGGFHLVTPPAREGVVCEAFRPRLWVPATDYHKPQVVLAKPLVEPLRLLVVTPELASRGVVEIADRLDCRLDYLVAGSHYGKAAPSASGKTVPQVLRASALESLRCRELLAQPHAAIVLAVVDADYFPVDIMEELFRQVKQDGAGLVLLYCGNAFKLLAPVLDAAKTASAAAELPPGYQVGRFGRGRVAVLAGERQYVKPDWYGENEGELQDLLRIVAWAAQGEPALRLTCPGLKRSADTQALAGAPLVVRVENRSRQPRRGTVRLTPRLNLLAAYPFYSSGNSMAFRPNATWADMAPPVEQPFAAAAEAAADVALALPLLPAGPYDFDLQALNGDGKVLAWERLSCVLTCPAAIATIALAALPKGRTLKVDVAAADRPSFGAMAEEALQASITVPESGNAVKARLQGLDPWGRMPFDQTVALRRHGPAGAAEFRTSLQSCFHMICVLRFSLLDAAGRELSEQRLLTYIFPRADRRPAFSLRGYAEVRVNNAVAGYDVRQGGESPESLAWHNILKSDYGGIIPGGKKVIVPGEKQLALPAEPKEPSSRAAAAVEDLALEEEKIDPKKGWYRVPCLTDPATHNAIVATARENYTHLSACYPYTGFATDEFWYAKEYDPANTVSFFRRAFVPDRDMNICRCTHCAAAFVAFARQLFGDELARLNRTWGTAFRSWEAVEIPLTVTDNATPPEPERWPYILGHRRFIETEVTRLMADVCQAVKAVHPDCETGMSGLWKTGIHNGIDIYQMAQFLRYNMLYSDIDLWTDFGESEAVRWVGYGGKYGFLMGNVTVWRELLAGQTGIGYYGKAGDTGPMHRPDFTFHDEPAQLFREVRNLKDSGLDRLLVRGRYRDPIALYYNPRDIHLAQLEDWQEDTPAFIEGMRNGGRGYVEYCYAVMNSYRGLLASRYLQPFWTAYAHLEAGNFGPRYGTPKLLLLPYSQCLTDRQAATLREFVKAGGMLVGDVHTGWRDGDANLRQRGALDDVFGIERQGEYRPRRRANRKDAAIPIRFGAEFGAPFELVFGAVGPGDVRPATARPLAACTLDGKEQPAFLVNRFGQGTAVYLNFIPAGYVAVEIKGEGESQDAKALEGKAAELFRRFSDKLVALAGLQPPLSFPEHTPAMVARFGEGDCSYLGLCSSRSVEALRAEYTVALPVKKHAYSARRGEYLGFTDRVTVRFREDPRLVADVISLLPYRLEGIAVELAATRVTAGQPLAFTARVKPAAAQSSRHVLAVRALAPDGQDPLCYRHSIETRDGAASSALATAASDTPGTWTLRVTDAATGVTQDTRFEVLKP